ncbi:hypothetical protein J6T21_03485 [Candidatus Saccharibacteria bacterium]|nr:hypothetical protein [Candidatus Saccharibacteria bacterium]
MTGMQIQNFKVFKEETTDERKELIEKIIHLWRNESRDYRENLQKYKELSERAKDEGLKIRKLKKSDLEDYPKCIVFAFEKEEEARSFLLQISTCNVTRLKVQLEICENTCMNYTYRTIKTILYEARYQTSLNQIKAKEATSSIDYNTYSYSFL